MTATDNDADWRHAPVEEGLRRFRASSSLVTGKGDDAETIHRQGHRKFRRWPLGADRKTAIRIFRIAGLQPSDKFVDVGCGALRGGRHFIEYLENGNYYGLDKHIELIIYGTIRELGFLGFGRKCRILPYPIR